MNWYNKIHIIKFAAAKSKIQRYNIANPSVKFFIHKYEESIPWDEVEKIKKSGGNVENFIEEYISSKLLPDLGGKIDPKSSDNNFMKPDFITDDDVTQELIHTEEAQGRTPKGVYSDALIQQARQQMLKDINDEKTLQFNEWWDYLNTEETYSNNPSFKYSILKPVIDSSPAEKKNGPPPLNAEILAGIWEEINEKGVDQMNILKKYRKLSIKAEEEKAKQSGVQETDKGGRWIRIKGGPNVSSDSELQENIKRLKSLSQGTGWCTGRGWAKTYLPQGDFYLYILNDMAMVAIRCVGNRVAEIRGHQNAQQNLDPYWKEVIDFLNTTKLDYKDDPFYQKLFDIYLMNAKLERGTDDYNTVFDQIKKSPRAYLKLSDENKQKFPEFTEAAAQGYGAELHELLNEIEDPNLKEDQYAYKFDRFQDRYNEIPPEVKEHLKEFDERVISVHKRAYYNNPTLFYEFPANIQTQFSEKEQKEGWFNYIEVDPYHYNDNRIPESIRQQIPVGNLKDKWKVMLEKNVEHMDFMPPEILNLFEPGEIEGFIIQDFAKFPVSTVGGKLDKLERVEKLVAKGTVNRQQILDIFADAVRKNPEWMARVPEHYKNELMSQTNISTVVEKGQKQHVVRDTGYFKSLPPDSQNALLEQYGTEIGDAFAKEQGRYRGLLHEFWINTPENVRLYMPYDTIDAVAQYYANLLNRNPQNFDATLQKIPVDIHPYIFPKLASGNSWYKKARGPRYPGQLQGDEFRGGPAVMTDVLNDNEIVEGEYVEVLRRMIKENDWNAVSEYIKKLRNEGHSKTRVDSMLTRAMHGVRF